MSLAGRNLLREQAPVEYDRPLPQLEFAVQGLAEPARPHLPGLLFVRHGAQAPLTVSFSLLPFSWGISLPLLNVSSPAFEYVISFSRVSVMSRFRIVSWPMRSRGENAESVFSMLSRSGWNVRFGDSVLRIE